MKSIALLMLLCFIAQQQLITPYSLLPVETTQNVTTSYSFLFSTDTNIPNSAFVRITFPYEFDPRALTLSNRARYSTNTSNLKIAPFKLVQRSFIIDIGSIQKGNLTIIIDKILNPTSAETSSFFIV
jgi:hypothetical protein